MFTMFHNTSRKICPKCFVKYSALIGSIAKISIRCSYTRCADSLCYNAHCRQSKSILSDNYSLHK